jgi:hypothetical protein
VSADDPAAAIEAARAAVSRERRARPEGPRTAMGSEVGSLTYSGLAAILIQAPADFLTTRAVSTRSRCA